MSDYKIYCLDDDPAVAAEVRQILEAGSSVHRYKDPALCLLEASQNRCDILIADIDLPKLYRIALIKNFKKHFPHVPLVVLTGYASVALATKCIQAGADELVRKPLDPTLFREAIKRSLTGYSILKMFEREKGLTKMEFMTLQYILTGRSTKEISFICNRSARTLESHRSGLMKKCDATNIMHLLTKPDILKYLKYKQEIQVFEPSLISRS